MCEPASPIKVLDGIPFRVASLTAGTEPGSYQRSLIDSVVKAVKCDVEYIKAQLNEHDIEELRNANRAS